MGAVCSCAPERKLDEILSAELAKKKWVMDSKDPVQLMKNLIKIQAAVRGYITRKNFKLLLCNHREVRTIQELRKVGAELIKSFGFSIEPFEYEFEKKKSYPKSFQYMVNKKDTGFYIGEW